MLVNNVSSDSELGISDCLNTFLTGPLLDRGKRRWRVRENHL